MYKALGDVSMENVSMEMINEKLDFILESLREPKEVFTLQEAMEYLCVGRTYMMRELEEGRIRFKKKGRDYLFKKIWLDDWMER